MKLFHLLITTSLFCSSLLVHTSYNPRREDPRYRTIFVQTVNNKRTACSADETIATVFQQCRDQGDCKGQQLTLRFDRYEIKEGTQAASKRFNEHDTLANEAFIYELLDNKSQTHAPNNGSVITWIIRWLLLTHT